MFKEFLPMSARRLWHWEIEQRWAASRLNPKSILPGDLYEGCNYHPMICIDNNRGDLSGISLVTAEVLCCSVFHCGPIKMDLLDAIQARRDRNMTILKDRTPLEIVEEFAVTRGDLSEDYARRQLAKWIERYAIQSVELSHLHVKKEENA